MRLKNLALAALMVAIIVAAIAFTVMRVKSEVTQQPTYLELEAKKLKAKIDMNSFEVFAETDDDWLSKYAPDKSGRFKNPKTGEYTMVEPMTCASCGQLIPVPADMPPPPHPFLGRGKGVDTAGAFAAAKALAEFKLKYKCPKCGKPAFPIIQSPTMPRSPNPAATTSPPQSK